MKKLVLLIILITSLVAFSQEQTYESDLETWCKENGHTWDPARICYVAKRGGAGAGLYIRSDESLVVTSLFSINNPISVGGSLIVRRGGDVLNLSTIQIQKGGRLNNYWYLHSCGKIQNSGTLYNGFILQNFRYSPKFYIECYGLIENQPQASIFNSGIITTGREGEPPSDYFVNQGVIYHYPCVGSQIRAVDLYGSSGDVTDISGINIDLDQCNYLPIVSMNSSSPTFEHLSPNKLYISPESPPLDSLRYPLNWI